MRVASSERVAGLGFLLITLLQIPYFVLRTPATHSGIATLAPLQVFCAKIAKTYPHARDAAELALLPGAWTSFCLFPYIRCLFKTSLQGPCHREESHLLDLGYAKQQANMQLLVDAISGKEFREATVIEYGCAMIVVSAAFSLIFSVKTAVIGFLLLGYGIFQGDHDALPPFIMSAFLCVYAGFQLGETRERLRQRDAARTQQQQGVQAGRGDEPAVASKAASSSTSSSSKSPSSKGGGSAKKRK